MSATLEFPNRLSIPARRVFHSIEFLDREPSVSTSVANAVRASQWLMVVDSFREAEESHLVEGDYDATLPEHRRVLATLIHFGEELLFSIKNHGMAESAGFKLEAIQATMDGLYETQRLEHGPHNHPKVTREIRVKLCAA